MKFSLAATLIFALAGAGCASIGPHPDVTVMDTEIKAAKKVEKILVLPTTGTTIGDPESDANKAVPGGAYERYHDNMLLAAGLDNALETLGMPKDVAPILPVNWQVAFYRWVKEGAAREAKAKGKDEETPKRPKSEMQLTVPASGKKIAKSDADLKKLSKALKKRKKAFDFVAKAQATGQADELEKAADKAHKPLVPVENLLRHIMLRLQVTYVLASHVEGGKAAYDKEEPVTLHVALINAETGKFRYYARSFGRKGDLPTSYEGLLGIMGHNVFEDIGPLDKIDF